VGFFEFWGCEPAYLPPAVPPFSLNGDPGELAACPGSFGAVLLRQVWLGCPVPEGLPAAAAGPLTARASPPASMPVAARVPRRTTNGLMVGLPSRIAAAKARGMKTGPLGARIVRQPGSPSTESCAERLGLRLGPGKRDKLGETILAHPLDILILVNRIAMSWAARPDLGPRGRRGM